MTYYFTPYLRPRAPRGPFARSPYIVRVITYTPALRRGSATDADEDAITGIIYLAELMDDDEVRLP